MSVGRCTSPNTTSSLPWPWQRLSHPRPWTGWCPSRPRSWPRLHPDVARAAGSNWPALVSGCVPKQSVVLRLVQFCPRASSESTCHTCNSCRVHATFVSMAFIRSAGASMPCRLRSARRAGLHRIKSKCGSGFHTPYCKAEQIWDYNLPFFHSNSIVIPSIRFISLK